MKQTKENSTTEKYKFFFSIGNKIKVKDLALKGKITGIFISTNEITYKVKYYYNGEGKDSFFEADELELDSNHENSLGFSDVKK